MFPNSNTSSSSLSSGFSKQKLLEVKLKMEKIDRDNYYIEGDEGQVLLRS